MDVAGDRGVHELFARADIAPQEQRGDGGQGHQLRRMRLDVKEVWNPLRPKVAASWDQAKAMSPSQS